MPDILDLQNPTVRSFRDALDAAVKEMGRRGLEHQALIVLAGKLQYRLASDCHTQRIPFSDPLEVLMRSVLAILDGAHPNDPYVREKFRVGIQSLYGSRLEHLEWLIDR